MAEMEVWVIFSQWDFYHFRSHFSQRFTVVMLFETEIEHFIKIRIHFSLIGVTTFLLFRANF